MATELATAGLKPDLKILLDLPVETALLRRMAHTTEINRLDRESISFHSRVREAYHSLVASDPGSWCVVDADRAPDDVLADVWHAVVSHGFLARDTEFIGR
jgi:uncharacterized protein YaaQ